MGLALSVLDVSPVPAGTSAREALHNTIDLARHVEGLGYGRYWLAEHHNTSGIASSTPDIMIGQVARATERMRVGSGGVMLPNHAPLRVVESFRVLEALFPGRIDLGLGRAPGTDQLTAFALRRSREAMSADDFPEQLAELLAFFEGAFPPDHPFSRITPVPDGVETPEIWLLGSTDFSARLAGELGLGFAFAHHISPEPAVAALQFYRRCFRPSKFFPEPRSIFAASVVCAETDAEAESIASSLDLVWLRIERGERGPILSPAEAQAYPYTPADRDRIRQNRNRHWVGTPAALHERLTRICSDSSADELMILTMVHDHEARRRSYELLANAFA